MTTYMVTGEAGSHSDWSGWLIAVWRDEASAMSEADTARQLTTREAQRRDDTGEPTWDLADIVAVVAIDAGGVRTIAAWKREQWGLLAGQWSPVSAGRWPGEGFPCCPHRKHRPA